MTDNTRYSALQLAVGFASTRAALSPSEVVAVAGEFASFLADGPIAASKPAKPAKPAKPTPPAAESETPPADETGTDETPPAEETPVKPAAKATDKPAATTKAKPEAKEPTMVEVQQAVVKLVTATDRETAIGFMKKTYGSPNVSGLDLTKFPYSVVLKGLEAEVARVKAAAENPAE